ncbi:MAG: 3-deoxy-manno-octulosonate cytidylyltransferase [Bdellovibrionales bacterium]|nr:3-deoxy-manno-octulosonate cytidylyltransferase [Bdellovibrionales bacterium]
MKIVGVIPARFASTRFPGKPLQPLLEKPLLQWVVEGVKTSKKIEKILVATDHDEIAALAESLGVEAVMTDSHLPSGSDRVWAAVKSFAADVVINIQGDEPLVTGELLDQLVEPFVQDPHLQMATLGRELDQNSLESKNSAKIVLDRDHCAIYFSRFPIPYSRLSSAENCDAALKHLGIYAYRKNFLQLFCSTPLTEIEQCEGLEQLRALYLGAKIKVVKTDHDSWGVDTPEDVEWVEKLIHERNSRGKN